MESTAKGTNSGSHWAYVSLAAFIVYLACLIAWRKLHPSGVLFYQGLVLALAIAAVQYLIQYARRKRRCASKGAAITFLVCYAFMFTVPTTVDRSYSVEMIMELGMHPEGMSRANIEESFAGYLAGDDGVQKRLTEQLATGSIIKHEDRYVLTDLGHSLGSFFRWLRKVFSIHRNEGMSN